MNTHLKTSGSPLMVLSLAVALSFTLTFLPAWLLISGFMSLLVFGWVCAFWNRF